MSYFKSKENLFVASIQLIALAVIFHALQRGGYIGQDWTVHAALIADPRPSLHFNAANAAPLLYVIGYCFIHILGGSFIGLSLLLATLNSLAVLILHSFSRSAIRGSLNRISMATFMTFLPLRMIHGTVTAADGLVLLPFLFLVLLSDRCVKSERKISEPRSPWERRFP